MQQGRPAFVLIIIVYDRPFPFIVASVNHRDEVNDFWRKRELDTAMHTCSRSGREAKAGRLCVEACLGYIS